MIGFADSSGPPFEALSPPWKCLMRHDAGAGLSYQPSSKGNSGGGNVPYLSYAQHLNAKLQPFLWTWFIYVAQIRIGKDCPVSLPPSPNISHRLSPSQTNPPWTVEQQRRQSLNFRYNKKWAGCSIERNGNRWTLAKLQPTEQKGLLLDAGPLFSALRAHGHTITYTSTHTLTLYIHIHTYTPQIEHEHASHHTHV